jgi:hypothetical protein
MNWTLVQYVFWMASLFLQVLVWSALLHGAWRTYPAVLVYMVCTTVTFTIEIVAGWIIGVSSKTYALLYYGNEITRQAAMLCVVLSLAVALAPPGRARRTSQRLILVGWGVLWIASLYLLWQPGLRVWMTGAIRNIAFGTAALNLIVWFGLASRPEKDIPRLLIAGGLGVQLAGDALGQAAQQAFSGSYAAIAGYIIIVVAHLVSLLIWWQALARSETNSRDNEEVFASRSARSLPAQPFDPEVSAKLH